MFESSEEAYLDLKTELDKIRTSGKVNISRPAPLFRDLALEWISKVVPATCRQSSVEDYDRILRLHVLAELGDMPVDTITRKKVKSLLLLKINEGKSPNTVNHIKNALSGVLKLAVEDEILPANPPLPSVWGAWGLPETAQSISSHSPERSFLL